MIMIQSCQVENSWNDEEISLGKRAELAFFEILTIKKARFEFQSSDQPFGEQIGCSNTQLILEGLRLLDEANRERQFTASH
jgi:uncharacterized protein DUF4388